MIIESIRPRLICVSLAMIVCAVNLSTAGFAAGTLLYDNTGNPSNTYYMGQSGAEAIDDLHLVSSGRLDTLTFEYYAPVPGSPFSATVRIYGNPGGLDADIEALAGPYVIGGLSAGRHVVSVRLADAPVVGTDLWVGVRFSSTTAGLIINDLPSVGHSHDLYFENGNLFWFGGDPRANFGLRLARGSVPVGVGVEPDRARVALTPARPNPFRSGSTLSYAIARHGRVRLDVLDVSGRHVSCLVNEVLEAGDYTARWSGRDDAGRLVSAGVYFIRLESQGTVASSRLVFAP